MRMGALPGLDTDLLRSFALIAEEGSFTRAAERVGRTQSAVSLQIRRLEEIVGQRVLARGKGGIVQLTPHGRYLLERSKELLALNDKIVSSLRAHPIHTEIRFGMPEDYTGLNVMQILARFSEAHPGVAVETLGAPACALVPLLKADEIDLMFCDGGVEPHGWPSIEISRGKLHWITSERHRPYDADPLPLALARGKCPWRPAGLDECIWRGAAIRALESAGRRYEIVSTSPNLDSLYATALTGLAVTVSTLPKLPAGLRPCDPAVRLPELPETRVLLLKARKARQPLTDLMAAHIASTYRTMADPSKAG